MFSSFSYLILAILGLSFLIFIHELGHYWMARRVGMRVETFSIGFGKPIASWIHNGVRWQIGWLLFGGYVRIAGTDVEKDGDPYQITDGYFGKSPWDRIKVAAAGPIANLLLAFILFGLIWISGGRDKNFSEFTSRIGWIDQNSELYNLGVRPGDAITSYDNRPFQGFKDHIYAPMVAEEQMKISGFKVDQFNEEKIPFEYSIHPYTHPSPIMEKGLRTTGVLQPASYVIYNRLHSGQENPLPEGSPLQNSGIQYGDRIFWVDGERIYSVAQMTSILNDGRVLLTIKRDDHTFLARVPRVTAQEFKLDSEFREELADWQYEAQLNNVKLQKLYILPYNIRSDGTVESQLCCIDKDKQEEVYPRHPSSPLETPLQSEDQIIAVDGTPIKHAYQLLYQLQRRRVHIIVERNPDLFEQINWSEADKQFDQTSLTKDLERIATSIGTNKEVTHSDGLYLLKSIVPISRQELAQLQDRRSGLVDEIQGQRQKIQEIDDPERRAQALQLLEEREKQLMIGLPMIQDRSVSYNPTPWDLFDQVFTEIWRTLSALFSGSLNPKYMSGPVGIVQVVQTQWKVGLNEAIYWLGAISLNLGILNLLPIPMLDGGSIVFSLFEMVTRRKIKPRTLEKLIIPFAILLIFFFVFITFNDLLRIFGGYFK